MTDHHQDVLSPQRQRELAARAERARAREAEQAATVRADPELPWFHVVPPTGRLNDPNGLVRVGETWHAFFQYSPLHPEKGVFWRHVVSENLADWRDEGTVMGPVDWYDRNGCYSGSGTVLPNGDLEFFYTGNVKDDAGNREAYQCLLVSTDGGRSFAKSAENPLIEGPEPGYTAHYRDPDVTVDEAGSGWRMLLGAQREDLTGAVVRYDSTDRRHWTFSGELVFDRPEIDRLGYMDECPALVHLHDQDTGEDRDVLLFCPQGMEPEGERFRNEDQSGYVSGVLDGTRFAQCSEFEELDAGFEFYAPQAFSGAGDRVLLMGWMGNPGQDEQPSLAHGWVHLLTAPRELTLHSGRIHQAPARELRERLPVRPVRCAPDGTIPALREQPRHRLTCTARMEADGALELVWEGRDGSEAVLEISQDRARVDRTRTHSTDGGSVRTRAVEPAEAHDVEVLFDASSLEIFLDGGACVFTLRAYLGEFAGVRVRPRGAAGAENLRAGVFLREEK